MPEKVVSRITTTPLQARHDNILQPLSTDLKTIVHTSFKILTPEKISFFFLYKQLVYIINYYQFK
jgi:hypothetical protein